MNVAYSIFLNGKRYEIEPAFRRIRVCLITQPKGRPGHLPPVKRIIDWDGPTGLAVRKALVEAGII